MKTYENFTSPQTQTVQILPDGATLVEYYYTRNTFSLTWSLNGGTSDGSEYTQAGQVKHGAKLAAPALPERVTTLPAGAGGFRAICPRLPPPTPWKADTHIVSFPTPTAARRSSVPEQVSVIYDAPAVTLPENTFTHRGYSFAGWNTKPDGSGTAYGGKAEISTSPQALLCMPSGRWIRMSPSPMSMRAVLPRSIRQPASYTVESEITLQAPTRTGYTFAGWKKTGASETVAIIPGAAQET